MKKKKISTLIIAIMLCVCSIAGVTIFAKRSGDSAKKSVAGTASADATSASDKGEKELVSLATGPSVETDEGEAALDEDEFEEKSNLDNNLKAKKDFKLNLVYDRLGMAKVNDYLNVRKKPSMRAKIVGKMTKFSGCNIYNIKKGWAKIVSGKVRGYVKAAFLYKDEAAEERAREVATLRANVKCTTLNVRFLPSTDSRIYDLISKGSDYDIKKLNIKEKWMNKYIERHAKKKDIKLTKKSNMMSDLKNWACVGIDDELCFVNKEFIRVSYKVDRAVKLHQKKDGTIVSKEGSSGGNSNGSSIVAYAMKFLGNPYVWGGTSLTNGCDCSGFTMSLYAAYGVSLPHFAASQANCTKSVSSSEARPGDLFFYGSGEISHVGMYIGNGQIIHASNSRTGIIISNAYYRTPVKIGRVG